MVNLALENLSKDRIGSFFRVGNAGSNSMRRILNLFTPPYEKYIQYPREYPSLVAPKRMHYIVAAFGDRSLQ